MVAAAASFSQPGGGGVGIPGFAMIGALALAVTVANGNNTGVSAWTFTVVDVPPGSAIPTGIVQTGTTPTWVFTPDKPGTYVVTETVTDGIVTVSDTRTFHVPESTGQIVPGFLETSAMDNYPLNSGNNLRGWATAAENWLRTLDVPLTTLTSGPVVLSSSNGFVEFNGGAGISVTLPSASTKPVRRFYYFKNKTNQSNTITPQIGDFIDGGGALTLTGTGAYAVLATDGAHNWNIISGEANSTTGGDATGPITSMTVVGWENKPLHSSMAAPNNLDVPQYDTGTLKWKSVAASSIVSGGVAPGSSGQIYITNGTPLAVWTSLINVNSTTGSFVANRQTAAGVFGDSITAQYTGSVVATMGVYNSVVGNGALYLGANAASAASNNYTLYADSANTLLNAGTTVGFRIANVSYMTLQTSALVLNNGVASVEFVHGRGTFGGGGSDAFAMLGPTPSNETTLAGVWLLLHGITPTASNTILSADGASAYLNSVSATGQINFVAGGANVFGSFDWNAKRFYAGGLGNTSPFIADWATSLQTQLGSGTNQTSMLIGNFNTGAASVIIQGGTGGITWRDGATQTTRGSIDLAHGIATFGGAGSDYKAVIGPDIGAVTAAALVHLLPPATTPTGTNFCLYGDGNVTVLNAQGSQVRVTTNSAASTMVWMNSGTFLNWGMDSFEWVTSLTPLLYQDVQTSDVACHDFTIRAQYAFATATLTHRTPGNVVFDIGLPTNGSTVEAAFKFTRNAIEGGRVGLSASGQWSLWLGQSAAFSSTNMAILSDASTFTYVNTTATGAFGIVSADATFLAYIPTTQNKWYFAGTTLAGSLITFDWSTSSAPTIAFNEGSAGTLLINPRTSDAATSTLTIKGSYAFATASGTNRIPGNIVMDVGAPTNLLTGVTNEAEFQWSRAGTVLQSFKFDNVNDLAIWRLPNTAWEWEWVVGNGEMLLANNAYAVGGGSAWWLSAQTTTVFMGGFVTSNAPLIFDFTTSTTPTISSGLLATQLSMGTSKSGASLILWAGASTVVATFTSTLATIGVGAGNISLVGSLQLTWRNSSSNFTIDTTTTDQSIHITATQAMTAPVPTTGRDLDLIVEAFGGSDVTLTINQHAAEKINNVAAAYVIVCASGQVQGWKMRSNGTDWYIFPG